MIPAITAFVSSILPRSVMSSDIALLLMIAVLLFMVELVFYIVPGVSLSTLLIGMVAIPFGFTPVLIISIFAILTAHFLIRKDITMFVPDIFTLIPMIAFAAFLGPWAIANLGWGLYGASLAVIKWGVAIPVGFTMGRNMAKRYREVILEPIVCFFIFAYLRFLFEWLV